MPVGPMRVRVALFTLGFAALIVGALAFVVAIGGARHDARQAVTISDATTHHLCVLLGDMQILAQARGDRDDAVLSALAADARVLFADYRCDQQPDVRRLCR